MTDAGLERRSYRVHGRVQGVGFRWWTRGIASRLGLGGTVRNRADGSVEVHAVGSAAALARLEEELRRGPRFALVERLEAIEPLAIPNPTEFRIEP